MKKYIIMASLLGLVSLPEVQAQIKTNVPVRADIANQNPFIDASSQSAYPSVGKGILFPRTNLTTFRFKTDLLDGSGTVFPTSFDGMLVYNTHVEDNVTINDPATGSYTLDLKEGFYYFSNPNGNTSGSLTGGKWKALGHDAAAATAVASFYSQNGSLNGNREVNLANHNLNFSGGKIGVNNSAPQATLDIKGKSVTVGSPSEAQGVIFPKFTTDERLTFQNTVEGTMIYNTTKKCLEIYKGIVSSTPQWECMTSSSSGSNSGGTGPGSGSGSNQGNLAVSATGFEGQYIAGLSLTTANKVKFTITNNGVTGINNVDFSNAVSAQNGAETIQVDGSANSSVSIAGGGQQELIYTLSGTPQQGKLIATFNKLGLQASQDTDVLTSSAAVNDRTIYVMSMTYQNEHVQGKINNTSEKITVDIPYVNGQTSNAAASIVQTSTAGQNSDSNSLTLNIPAKSSNNTGQVTATLHVGEDGEYLVKQMAPGTEYTIATFNVDMGGQHYRIFIKGTGGIKDRKFDSNSTDHKFVYVPVQVVKGDYNKTWLTMNLGAQRSKIGASGFDPDTKKYGGSAANDSYLYGSSYQWQRPSDGHEFRNSTTTNTQATNWQATTPSSVIGLFIKAGGSQSYNWVVGGENVTSGPYTQFWQAGGQNNPCPSGYHVPTIDEWKEFHTAMTGSTSTYLSSSAMYNQQYLPNVSFAGLRSYSNGAFSSTGDYVFYWSSTSNENYGNQAQMSYWSTNSSRPEYNYVRSNGASVRCIKD